MNIEEKILKFLHSFFPDIRVFPNGIIPLENLGLDPHQDALEFGKVFDHLKDNYYVEKDGITISITIQGISYYEEKYLNPDYYFIKAIRIILEYLEKLENGEYADNSIPNSEIIDEMENEGISMDNKKFYQFIVALEQRTSLFKNIGPFGIQTQDKINAYSKNKPILTPIGRQILNDWRYEHELFSTITDQTQKNILLGEFNELQKCIQQGSWKDACIKIGGIIEYLLTIWLQNKGVSPSQVTNNTRINEWKRVKFHIMIEFYMNNIKNYSDEISTYIDWNLVKNILKDYRNDVHLLKYEERVKQGSILNQKEFEKIYPIFQEIIDNF